MQIIEVVKQHPVPIAIGVVVLLLIVSRGGSSASASSNGSALAAASMSNNTQLAGINSDMSVKLGAQATERFTASENAALARTSVAASLLNNMVSTSAGLQASNANTVAGMVEKSQNAANNREQMELNAVTQRYQIGSNVQSNIDNLNAQMTMHAQDNNTKILGIGMATQGQLDLLHAQGSISTTQLGMNIAGAKDMLGMNLASQATTLPMLLQNTQEMARINGANSANLATINTQAANTKAQADKNSSDWGIVGNFASAIASFF